MSAIESVRQWTIGLEEVFGSAVHGHVSKALGALSFAMCLARSCGSLEVGSCLPGVALAASVRRRLERFLANDRLEVQAVYARLCGVLGEARRGRRLVLIVDETDRDERLRSLRILAAMSIAACRCWRWLTARNIRRCR